VAALFPAKTKDGKILWCVWRPSGLKTLQTLI
jgi:hypothetical protein